MGPLFLLGKPHVITNIQRIDLMKKKILVTGGAGYIGTVFLEKLIKKHPENEVISLDKSDPNSPILGVRYIKSDISSTSWEEIIKHESPEILVHLAFIVNPIRDEQLMHIINFEGTKKTLETAINSGVKQILVASSATAYGAYPDNPLPLTEEHPIRLHDKFQYAKDKGLLEHYFMGLSNVHPTVKISVIRPVIVLGPNVQNYLSRFLFAFPIVPLINGGKTPIQFVHEEDVAEIMILILEQGVEGPFNIAGDEWLTLIEICHILKRPSLTLPRWAILSLIKLMRFFRLKRMESPHTIIDYLHYPWVVSTQKTYNELGYKMKYSSLETIKTLRNS